jgi:predicted aminopeptidase
MNGTALQRAATILSMLLRLPPQNLTRLLLGVLAAVSATGCSTIGYYGHLAHGEYAMLAARRPIERVVADPDVDASLKARLRLAEEARAFASERLGAATPATQYADPPGPMRPGMCLPLRNSPSMRSSAAT